MENQNYIMREITPLSERDCFYIADRHKTEFTYPIHCHAEYELNFTEHALSLIHIWVFSRILHLHFGHQHSLVERSFQRGRYKYAERSYMQRRRLVQPYICLLYTSTMAV